jgi:hypothetical protein
VLRAQLQRREELLVSQRSAYYKELMQHASYAALNGTLARPLPPLAMALFAKPCPRRAWMERVGS